MESTQSKCSAGLQTGCYAGVPARTCQKQSLRAPDLDFEFGESAKPWCLQSLGAPGLDFETGESANPYLPSSTARFKPKNHLSY